MTRSLRPVGLDFFDRAGYRRTVAVQIARPPAAVFSAIATDPAGWGAWFPGFSHAGHYLGDEPHGVGSIRRMAMLGMPLVETIIAWDEPTRFAFHIDRPALPGARAFAEDYLVEPDGAHARLTWVLALDLAPAARPLGTVLGAVLAKAVRRAGANLERHLAPSAGA